MFRNNLVTILALLSLSITTNAQVRYFTKSGKIEFQSKASMEDIEAKNKAAAAVLDTKTGAIQFSVLMKGFEFEKALMQEHFNENYVESDKYPKAEFKGSVINNGEVNYSRSGTYKVIVRGKLSLHGVTKEVEAPGTIKVDGDKIDANSAFNIQLSDYAVSIPSVVKNKISNSITILVDCKLEPLK